MDAQCNAWRERWDVRKRLGRYQRVGGTPTRLFRLLLSDDVDPPVERATGAGGVIGNWPGFAETFLPGGRTNWHTHPLGQTLYVVSGEGRYQTEGKQVVAIQAGDTIWIPPGERHWHGAAPNQMMCHIAFQEALDGSHISWQEPVSEEAYVADPE